MDLVTRIARKNAHHDRMTLYHELTNDSLPSYIDPLLDRMMDSGAYRAPILHEFARFLASKSPDRGPVKFGIALLGLIADKTDKDIVKLLGRHEEFTLYSAVAVTHMSEDPDEELWDLAKSVQGWGRIETVERLVKTKNPDIKRWLLREGYRNDIMPIYTAFACATAGDLRSAITADKVDQELLNAAGDILLALAIGGPAEGMNDYQDAAVAVRAYLNHLKSEAKRLNHYLSVKSIRDYLESADWKAEERLKNGWDDITRPEAIKICSTILDSPEWPERVMENLKSNDEPVFYDADLVAKSLGIDI